MGCCRVTRKRREEPPPESELFHLLTPEDVLALEKRSQEEARHREAVKERRRRRAKGEPTNTAEASPAAGNGVAEGKLGDEESEEEEPPEEEKKHEKGAKKLNPKLEAGSKLSPRYAADFPAHFVGQPLREVDSYYFDKETFVIISRDKTLFRFSCTKVLFLLNPFNPIRRVAMTTLVHPLFNFLIVLTILLNCIFMAGVSKKLSDSNANLVEYVFTAIYTAEFLVKMLARGFVLKNFTYLRDPWNWLDFVVILIAYFEFTKDILSHYYEFIPSGDEGGSSGLAALRSFRVLRALKAVAVVPGLKTIVSALMEAVIRLRDVMILTLFILSIFALVGLQLFMGTLSAKCVDMPFTNTTNATEYQIHIQNESHWFSEPPSNGLCRLGAVWPESGSCPPGFFCAKFVGQNPNFGYTSWDNFGWSLLCAFRLMTQDYWESLYYLTIRANGELYMVFFVLVILLGSFYLINLILAIVAMSYDDQQRRDAENAASDQKERDMEEELKLATDLIIENLTAEPELAAETEQEQVVARNLVANSINPGGSSIAPSYTASIRSRVNSVRAQPASLSLPGSPNVRRHRSHSSLIQTFSDKAYTNNNAARRHKKPDNLDLTGVKTLASDPLTGDSIIRFPFIDQSNVPSPQSEQELHFEFGGGGMANGTAGGGDLQRASSYRFRRGDIRRSLRSAASEKSFHSRASGGGSVSRRRVTAPHGRQGGSGNTLSVALTDRDAEKGGSPGAGKGMALPELMVDYQPMQGLDMGLGPDYFSPLAAKSLQSLHPSEHMVDLNDVVALREAIDVMKTQEAHGTTKDVFFAKLNRRFCSWNCCKGWEIFSKYVDLLIMDAFAEVFVTLAILFNTAFMAMEYYSDAPDSNMKEIEGVLKISNFVFTSIFTAECALKLIAMSPVRYFKDSWNIFDFFIVALSLIELMIPEGTFPGFSVLRSFRLLRVLKLAKSWPTLNLLMGIVGRTLGALGNLCIVLAIVIFIFAVMGNQLFAEEYVKHSEILIAECNDARNASGVSSTGVLDIDSCEREHDLPRWNFDDFLQAFMIVFRVLCGEWIESMWDCMQWAEMNQHFCVPFFLLTMVIGNLVVLNLFLALLLSAFSGDSLAAGGSEEEPNKMAEAYGRIVRLINWTKKKLMQCFNIKPKVKERKTSSSMDTVHVCDVCDGDRSAQDLTTNGRANYLKSSKEKLSVTDVEDEQEKEKNMTLFTLEQLEAMGEVVYVHYPDSCFCNVCHRKMPCCLTFNDTAIGKKLWGLRCFLYKLVEHKYFETFIISCILISSASLALEDIYLKQRPILAAILNYLDKLFTGIFICEMVIKWIAFGWKKYFTDAWCWLDFVIVCISILSLVLAGIGMENLAAFKAMRTLRALRPLRAVSRWEGMRVVVNALIQAIPSISNVLLVILVFWLIFAIMGVNFFSGKFYRCVDGEGRRLDHEYIFENGSVATLTKKICLSEAEDNNQPFEWKNAPIHFNNVGAAYLALLQVATFKGWTEIIENAVDSQELDVQPLKNGKRAYYLYFVAFIVFGSFFTLNLFIGVIIENFNAMKKKGGSIEMFLTEDQKKYYNAMKKLSGKSPQKAIPEPKWAPQKLMFDVVTSQKFDMAIMAFIMFNMVTMCVEHSQMSDSFTTVLKYVNMIFIVVFTLESVLKIFALRLHYFKYPWNVFDFVVVVLSILGQAFEKVITTHMSMNPTVLRVIRVFRVGRVLRLIKSAKGIRTLLFSLAVSLPALFNIGLLLFMVIFIFSTFGMAFFSDVKYHRGIDNTFNFETFFRSLITLFQCSTSAGWSEVHAGLVNEEDCGPEWKSNSTIDPLLPTDCGNKMGTPFIVAYLMLTFLVIVNMYIAVILENFSQATEDVQQGLTQDDFDMFYELWEKYDPKATKYIKLDKIGDFVDDLEEPLRIPKPNFFKLVTMKIPVCRGSEVHDDEHVIHCTDLLDALTKNFLGALDDPTDNLQPVTNRGEGYEPVTNTLDLQKEKSAARLIEQAYIKYRRSHGKPCTIRPVGSKRLSKKRDSAATPIEEGDEKGLGEEIGSEKTEENGDITNTLPAASTNGVANTGRAGSVDSQPGVDDTVTVLCEDKKRSAGEE